MCGNVHMDTCYCRLLRPRSFPRGALGIRTVTFPSPSPSAVGSTSTDPTAKFPCASWSATVVTYYTHRERHHAITRVMCVTRDGARCPPRRDAPRAVRSARLASCARPNDQNTSSGLRTPMRMRRSSSSVVRAARAHSRTRAATVVKSIDCANDDGTTRRDVRGRCRVPRSSRGRVNASSRARRWLTNDRWT